MTTPVRPPHAKLRQPQPQKLAGVGLVLAAGVKAARVTYEIFIEDGPGQIGGRGTLRAKHTTLKRMWLQPEATLRLADGRRFDISITDLKGITAIFELTGEA